VALPPDFFAWAFKNGCEMASSLEARWKSEIKDDAGKPIF
jgi:hypothetical protein